jgi:sigma-B regulation protein RsbU (phosphoserine phosphatase)
MPRPGGLGLLLIRNFSDELSYSHSQGRNHLTITVSWVERHMTRAAPDWLLELRNARAAGFDAIALFRGVEPSVIVDAIADCEIRTLPVGATLLRPGQSNDTIYVLSLRPTRPPTSTARVRAETGSLYSRARAVGEMSAIDGKPGLGTGRRCNGIGAFCCCRASCSGGRLGYIPPPLPGVARNLLAFARRPDAPLATRPCWRRSASKLALEHGFGASLQIARQLQTSMIPLRGRPLSRARRYRDRRHDGSLIRGWWRFLRRILRRRAAPFPLYRRCVGPRIAAALFMARAIGLIRIAAMGTRHPEQLLERINEQLCARNCSNIFVTLFCAFLDVVSGRLVYANGGHCPPFLADERARVVTADAQRRADWRHAGAALHGK